MKGTSPTVLLTALFALWSCGSSSDRHSDPFIEVVDDTGAVVVLQEKPWRIVSLAPNITELLFAAGAGAQVAGVSTADDYPEAVGDLPRFSAVPLNVEALATLNPDLVVAAETFNPQQHLEALGRLNIPLFVLSFDTLEDIWNAIDRLGAITGNAASAKATKQSILSRLEPFEERSKMKRQVPTVLLLLGTERLYAFGGDSYITDVIRLSGGQSATAGYEGPSAVLTEEFVLRCDPDVIVGAFMGTASMDLLLRNHPSWSVLSAVRNDRLCTVNPDFLLRPGPRLVEGIKAISACLAEFGLRASQVD